MTMTDYAAEAINKLATELAGLREDMEEIRGLVKPLSTMPETVTETVARLVDELATAKALAVRVNEEDWALFLDTFLNHPDLYQRGYCGYWLYGAAKTSRGWLVFEDDGEQPPDSVVPDDVIDEAVVEWESTGEVPKPFMGLTEAVLRKAYVEGVIRWGQDWAAERGAESVDVVVQVALLGEVRYG